MSELFKMHKKPWKANKRGDGYWYVEDANGHAVASIVTSCKEHAEEIAMELLMPKEMAGLGLKAADALGYLDGMPERSKGHRFDDHIDGGDITANVMGYIIHLENELGICIK